MSGKLEQNVLPPKMSKVLLKLLLQKLIPCRSNRTQLFSFLLLFTLMPCSYKCGTEESIFTLLNEINGISFLLY